MNAGKRKQFWINKVHNQIYLLGVNFPRDYYDEKVLPKCTIKKLKAFYFAYEEVRLNQEFQLSLAGFNRASMNRNTDWEKVRKINTVNHKIKVNLTEMLIDGN